MIPGAAVRIKGVKIWKEPPLDTAGLQEMPSLHQAQSSREITCPRSHSKLAIKLEVFLHVRWFIFTELP